jgi:serine/threonine protein kinase
LEVFETDNNIMLVMEYAEGGDLLSYVKKHGIVGERQAK